MAWDINAFNLAQLIEIKDGPDKNGHTYVDGRHQETIADFRGENAIENAAMVKKAINLLNGSLKSNLIEIEKSLEAIRIENRTNPLITSETHNALLTLNEIFRSMS